ncbi:hypothetical protein IPC1622_29085 [Pseudomonas aeruginosa]|uniref:hypothetical protein n=1 Tax=Pseudomonas aeruginosa TaxID=287 RepID=UPI000F8242E6|nr:hypothetical protein [Pseudomonas aeruginosa]ELS1858915.1 hypothetical protein [Pseudomonas aeruginosa]MCQ9820458.1 hypothetical protein [Pseudomonas aeruginosa]RTU07412.1 hypothetical protein DY966_02515 [Pseudomonas aeruginosa]RUA40372.1 hypothetical protein IPC1622_29085 [Pseudomonas aeruginosa]
MSNSEKRPLIRRHIGLEELLQLATPDELVAISEVLLDKAHDRLLGDDSTRQRLAQCFAAGELYKAVAEIAYEIRALGSVSLASLLRRGEPVSYDEVVRDVAGELKVAFSKADSTAVVEEQVLAKLIEKLAEQAESTEADSQTEKGSWFGRARLNKPFSAVLGPLGKLGMGAAGGGLLSGALGSVAAVGSVAAAGVVAALPLTAISAVSAGVWAFNNKKRPELQGLAAIVMHIARIRAGAVAEDHEEFAKRLRACL